MNRRMRRTASLTTMLLLILPSASLHAQEFATRAFGGYGTTNGYGWGIGADVGIQFPLPILVPLPTFVGAWGAYQFGNEWFDEEIGVEVDGKTALFGLEVAAEWLQKPIYIRGNGIIGAARVGRSVEQGTTAWETNFLLSGGVIFGREFGNWAVGLEPHFPLVIGSDATSTAFILYLSIGYVTSRSPAAGET